MKINHFFKKSFSISLVGMFLTFGFPAWGQLYYEKDFFEQSGSMSISGCFGSKEDSLQYYYYDILHYVVLVKYEDTITPIAIVNEYHPTENPEEPDLKYDPDIEKLEFIPVIGYISSPNGMWGLYIYDFLNDRPFIPLGENRNPEEIFRLAGQFPCPKEVPNDYYQEIIEDLEE